MAKGILIKLYIQACMSPPLAAQEAELQDQVKHSSALQSSGVTNDGT